MDSKENSLNVKLIIAEWLTLGSLLIGGILFLSNQIHVFDQRMQLHDQRIDQLYQMFIDVVKERK